jgi:hypothetical protein
MFKKKEKKSFVPSITDGMEELSNDPKRIRYANRITMKGFSELFSINQYLVVSFLETGELFKVYDRTEFQNELKEGKIKLFKAQKDASKEETE